MDTLKQGNLGKAKLVHHLMANGYEVFSPFTENASCDLIAVLDGKPLRVEVKTTSQKVGNSWAVELKSVRSNRTKNVIRNFDGTKSDLLAVYIVPEDRVVLFDSVEMHGKTAKRIKAI